jgi:glycosyltransferase involved in cell wall biosynthesis
VESHDLGVVVDRTDPAALAVGLRAMLSDDAGRRRVAEAGPAAVRETFSVERVGEQVGALYGEVVGAHR